MGQLIKTFSDGSFIEYDRGSFDAWCVYFTSPSGRRNPPRDTDYFAQLKDLARRYGANRLYEDYVTVYNWTGKRVDNNTLAAITQLSYAYGEDALTVDIIFSILYVAMIAEENKANTKLGKRIKRLGIYVLLLEDKPVSHAANFMRGKGWRDIARDCNERLTIKSQAKIVNWRKRQRAQKGHSKANVR